MKKCNYFNNTQTACSLMIDDILPIAIYPFNDNYIWAKYDWGYLEDGEKSLYNYFQNNLLKRYPEIKGTFFISIKPNNSINEISGYKISKNNYDNDFLSFIKRISLHFDFAFHGTSHGNFFNSNNPDYNNNWQQEFEYLTLKDINRFRDEIQDFENKSGLYFSGGKYPGYMNNEFSEEILEKLGFKWWASSSNMLNSKISKNQHEYFGKRNKILDLPTNLGGDICNIQLVSLSPLVKLKQRIKKIIGYNKKVSPFEYIQYLYENQLPITIQEHFQNQRTDGKRQTPNIFDDINSLNMIYGILRGADIWYTSCSDLAHYLESYDNTEIISNGEKQVEIKYNGRWDKMFLSFASTHREIKNMETAKVNHGVYKNGEWIFNDLNEGKYFLI